jgi:hypothetical protein
MTIAIGASTITSASFPSSTTTTTGITTGAAGSGFYVVVITHGSTASTVAIADSKSNAYTQISQIFDTDQNYVDRFYCPAGTGGAGHTWTATLSPNNASGITIIPIEMTGAATSSIHDASSPAAVIVNQVAPVSSNSFSATPPSGGEMLISVFTTDYYFNPIAFTAPTSFTLIQSQTNGTSTLGGCAVAYEVITSSGTAQAVNWNNGTNGGNQTVTLDGFLGLSGPVTNYVQSTSYHGANSSSVTCSSPITPLLNDTLLCFARVGTTGGPLSNINGCTISDGHNAYTLQNVFNDGSSNAIAFYVAINAAAASIEPTATLSSGTNLTDILVLDYQNVYTLLGYTGAFQTGPGSNNANFLSSGSVSISASAILIGVAANLTFGGTPPAAGTSPLAFASRATVWGNNLTVEDATTASNHAATAGTVTGNNNQYFLTMGMAFSLTPAQAAIPSWTRQWFVNDIYVQF